LLKLKEVFSFLKKEGMMSEWREYKLKQLTIKIGSGATPRGGSNSYKEAGISLIRSQNVLDFGFSESGLAFIDEEQANQLKNVEVLSNDILLNITGDSVARCCIVPDKYLPARVNQHVSIIRLISEKANQQFIFYYLQYLKPELLISAEIGATRNAITKGMIEEIEISLPPLPEQRAIASILSSLDDKIDLLHRQNATLEKLAETLFRQWFVEEAGEEWEEGKLFDAIEIVGGGTPNTAIEKYWDGEIKWLSGGDIAANHKNIIIASEKTITSEGLNNSSTKLLPKFSTVISARGTVGKYCILSEPMAFSQSNYGIKPKYKDCFFFTYLLVNHSVEELQSAAYGSVFDTITTNTFKGIDVVLPPLFLVREFEKKVEPYFMKMLANQSQIRTLTAMRDSLLPKLMSGEVRVEID
jgi:type I restriction enzyme S subunit